MICNMFMKPHKDLSFESEVKKKDKNTYLELCGNWICTLLVGAWCRRYWRGCIHYRIRSVQSGDRNQTSPSLLVERTTMLVGFSRVTFTKEYYQESTPIYSTLHDMLLERLKALSCMKVPSYYVSIYCLRTDQASNPDFTARMTQQFSCRNRNDNHWSNRQTGHANTEQLMESPKWPCSLKSQTVRRDQITILSQFSRHHTACRKIFIKRRKQLNKWYNTIRPLFSLFCITNYSCSAAIHLVVFRRYRRK